MLLAYYCGALTPYPAYAREMWRNLMRVPDDVIGTTVFLGMENDRGAFVPTGTGFVIWVPYADHGFRFVVTAQHVIDDLIGKKASFRLNRKNGGCESVRFQPEAHCGFHDKSVDVAIIPFEA